jgi:hypothetical protein
VITFTLWYAAICSMRNVSASSACGTWVLMDNKSGCCPQVWLGCSSSMGCQLHNTSPLNNSAAVQHKGPWLLAEGLGPLQPTPTGHHASLQRQGPGTSQRRLVADCSDSKNCWSHARSCAELVTSSSAHQCSIISVSAYCFAHLPWSRQDVGGNSLLPCACHSWCSVGAS